MPTNETRRELLNRAKAAGYPGSITEVFQAADQGIDLIEQHGLQQQEQQMQVAQTPQEQEVGLREEHAAGNTDASMAFPDVQPNQSFNTVGMEAPIDIQKIDNQGHLVESYKNVPPGIQDLPTGPSEGTIIESPAAYQIGGFNKDALTSYNDSTASYNMQLQKNKLINEADASYGESNIRKKNQKKVANLTKKQKDLGIYIEDEPEYTFDKAYNLVRDKDNKIKYPKDPDKTRYKTTSAESLKPTRSTFHETSVSPIEMQNESLSLQKGLAGELMLNNNKLKYRKIRGTKNKYFKISTGETVKIRSQKINRFRKQTGGERRNDLKIAISNVSTNAREKKLLESTNFAENSMGYNPAAYGREYTNSQASIDPIMLNDLFDERVDEDGKKQGYSKTQKKYFKRFKNLGLPTDKKGFKEELNKDNSVAAVEAMRMVYGRTPEAIPEVTDTLGMFHYYNDNYRKNNKIKDLTQSKARFYEGYKTNFQFGGLKEKVLSLKNTYDKVSSPMLVNRKNLKMQANIKPENQSIAFNTTYNPTKNSILKGGVTYALGQGPQYNASLNLKFKKGGYTKTYKKRFK